MYVFELEFRWPKGAKKEIYEFSAATVAGCSPGCRPYEEYDGNRDPYAPVDWDSPGM